MATPLISLIVPVYNGGKYIEGFMKCVEGQSFESYEVLFVDDGSTDNTYAVCDAISKENEKVRVIHKENGGPSSARNAGIKEATGEYLAFFDIDDEFHENVLSDNYAIAKENDADVVMWNFKVIVEGRDDDKKEIIRPIGRSFAGDDRSFFHDILIATIDNEMFNPPWNKLIRSEFLRKNEILFDERFSIYEDILFSYHVFHAAKKVSVNDKVYYSYIIKQSGSLLTKLHKECFDAILAIYNAAVRYGEAFDDNREQMKRFGGQFIYLVKGHIKQICINRSLAYVEKKELLSRISKDDTYIKLSREYDNDGRGFFARHMMNCHMYRALICYYHVIDFVRFGLNEG